MPSLEPSHVIHLNAQNSNESAFSNLLFAHVPEQDKNAYMPQELTSSAQLGLQALLQQTRGERLIHIDHKAITRSGRSITVITLVNDNRPFLLDSVMAEIGENATSLYLVAHPVFDVDEDLSAPVAEISVETASPTPAQGKRRVSLMQFHISPLGKEQSTHLQQKLTQVLEQGEAAVRDWQPMVEHVAKLAAHYRTLSLTTHQAATKQTADFLAWLCQDNFIFLGLREDKIKHQDEGKNLQSQAKTLGILCDASIRILHENDNQTMPESVLNFMQSDDLLLVTKARTLSLVHRRARLDYIGIKLFDTSGQLQGELHLVGLFASTAYTDSVLSIPYLKPKAEAVIASLGFNPQGHSGRMLVDELEIYPRDEMFRIDVAALTSNIEQILALGERPRIRVLANAERFGHFVTVLVFLPRDRFDSAIREKIGNVLLKSYQADFFEFFPLFLKNGLTRIRYTLHRKRGDVPEVNQNILEETIERLIHNWQDKVMMAANAQKINPDIAALAISFPDAYRDAFDENTALQDAAMIHALSLQNPLQVHFYHHDETQKQAVSLKLIHHGKALELSSRVPLLENMGFRVIAEQTFELPDGQRGDGERSGFVYLHDMELKHAEGAEVDLSCGSERFNQAFEAVWSGNAYNDAFNLLIQSAKFDWFEAVILRTLGRYLQQVNVPYSQAALAKALDRYPDIARNLYALFAVKFDPFYETQDKEQERKRLEETIEQTLVNVPSLEDDRILRNFRTLIHAALRTNAFKLRQINKMGETIAIKFDPAQIDFLPLPVPYREIFVYGRQVQGVHLRFGPVARGGIRWSDRGQDYRTEVLGLVKAQQVKNAVIVPVGAKGGFYPHNLPKGADRAQINEAGRQAYISYISAMLSITDNIVDGKIVKPADILCHDGDDAYFVVAADKGTATFSDTANAISQQNQFWLDDAFASGGSVGYDHKAMGITARGAWEAVKRHFREIGHDIQTEAFTCVGVGDMSGDVFGNGMLLSEQTKLLAAFDHRDIFIDPNPDPALSYAERQRLFNLPRSSWQDYDKTKLSAGGAVFSRSLKTIPLSAQARAAIGFDKEHATPNEIIHAILKAPVDLLWFGGIGTYVRGRSETDAQVGDHANDAIRITGSEIRAKIVGEGANLGMTQRGRIDYAAIGGRSNTDAIDNSAGVNCSDVEVNIKIALANAVTKGKIDRPARDELLKSMSDDVAQLVLRNNYIQPQALSMAQMRAVIDLPYQIRFMNELERHGLLDRQVEALPDNQILSERQRQGQGLTRPELCVIMAYAKITLQAQLASNPLVHDPYFDKMLLDYFPASMRQNFAQEITEHPLRRDIIATLIANDVVNRGGPTFVNRLQDKTGRGLAEVIRSYIVLRDGFSVSKLYEAIDSLDNKVSGLVQNTLMGAIAHTLFHITDWLVRNSDVNSSLSDQILRIKVAHKTIDAQLGKLVSPSLREKIIKKTAAFEAQGAPSELANQLGRLEAAAIIPDIMLLAAQTNASLERTAGCYFALSEHIGINKLEEAASSIPVLDYYDGMALSQANDQIVEFLRQLVSHVLTSHSSSQDPAQNWLMAVPLHVKENIEQMQALTRGDMTLSRFIVAAGMMRDLART